MDERKEMSLMDITSCYTVKLKVQMTSRCPGKKCSTDDFTGEMKVSDALMRSTANECLSAYSMCCALFLKDWDEIRLYPSMPEPNIRSKKRFCDILIHSTKDSDARYPEFDKKTCRLPVLYETCCHSGRNRCRQQLCVKS